MPKKPFDLLVSDKSPIEYVERSTIRVDDGCLVAYSVCPTTGESITRQIPCASTALLFLGPGVSISSDAARMAALHDMHVGFVRGGSNVHSVWMCGRWKDPRRVVSQCMRYNSPQERIRIARTLVGYRLRREGADSETITRSKEAISIEELLGIEASWAKKLYRSVADETQQIFKRDLKSHKGVNGALSLLNNALYSIVTMVIIQCGLSPSVGFVHGQSRRGGLSFDLADLYKKNLTIIPAFRGHHLGHQYLMQNFSESLRHGYSSAVREMIEICNWIVEGGEWPLE